MVLPADGGALCSNCSCAPTHPAGKFEGFLGFGGYCFVVVVVVIVVVVVLLLLKTRLKLIKAGRLFRYL